MTLIHRLFLKAFTATAIVLAIAAGNVFSQDPGGPANPELAPAIAEVYLIKSQAHVGFNADAPVVRPGESKEARQTRWSVKYILVTESLPFGLTEAAVAAAKRIKFVPAAISGKPVSTYMQLEYNFAIF